MNTKGGLKQRKFLVSRNCPCRENREIGILDFSIKVNFVRGGVIIVVDILQQELRRINIEKKERLGENNGYNDVTNFVLQTLFAGNYK